MRTPVQLRPGIAVGERIPPSMTVANWVRFVGSGSGRPFEIRWELERDDSPGTSPWVTLQPIDQVAAIAKAAEKRALVIL
jgi:hypothetical protein